MQIEPRWREVIPVEGAPVPQDCEYRFAPDGWRDRGHMPSKVFTKSMVGLHMGGPVEYRVPCNRDAVGHSLESRASSMQTIELTDFEDRALASGRLTQIRRDMDPQPTQAANGSLGWDGVLFWDQPQMLAERCPFGKPGSMFRVKSWTWADAPVYTIASVRVERVRSITQGDLLACGADGGPSMYHNWCLATGNNNPERWQWVIDFTSTEDCNDAQS